MRTIGSLEQYKYLHKHVSWLLGLPFLIDDHSLHDAVLGGLVGDLCLKLIINVFWANHILQHHASRRLKQPNRRVRHEARLIEIQTTCTLPAVAPRASFCMRA